MGIITILILSFTAIRLGVALYNRIGPVYLPHIPEGDISTLSILVPARNEACNLPFLLEDILRLPAFPLEVLIYDDQSTDGTAGIISAFHRRNSCIRGITGEALPPGWLGKNYACHRLAKEAKGKYLLFLDADVRIEPDFPRRAVRYMQEQQVELLSLFPRQVITYRGTWLTVPLMNWILLSLLPVPLVRKLPQESLAAANGQCMLFTKERYCELLPHEKVKDDPVEDISIMRFYKRAALPVSLLLGSDDISCRMYSGVAESVNGFSKNIFRFFGNSKLMAFLFAAYTTFSGVWLVINAGWWPAVIYLGMVVLIRILCSVSSRQPVWLNLMAGIPQQLFFWIILIHAWVKNKKRQYNGKKELLPDLHSHNYGLYAVTIYHRQRICIPYL